MNRGTWYAVGAYGLWGLFPIYWKWLIHVPATQLLAHRILWSFVSLFIAAMFLHEWRSLSRAVLRAKVLGIYSVAAMLICINWFLYVWAVNAGFIVETSLGYFINPLISVLMGVVFLRERLRPRQWVPVGLAAAGVFYLTFTYGSLPWIALVLAFSWATYGLIKKTSPLGSLPGLTLETGLLLLPMLIYLGYVELAGKGAFLHEGILCDILLVGTGLITAVPLLMFASAVRRIPLSLIGILQYIAPTLQFLIGVLVYKEPFTVNKLVGFGLVWLALIVFGVESFLTHRAHSLLLAQHRSRGLSS
ncbi:MAG: RarD protein, superfamily transporter [Deltaproteobacteria bacterium]|jgi:chloramphenicol-sensitive protein RarD|nr:RarD protein, superfamily transporter [Deltaproteobacteria bacterium]